MAILENRLTKTIRENFMNRYTNRERAAVKSVVVDLNAQYIKALFSNARSIIDRSLNRSTMRIRMYSMH